ncbi:MAG: hypothetical protein EOO67_12965, partial [Microbacterium sp.]
MPAALRTLGLLRRELGRAGRDLLPSSGALPAQAADFDAATLSRLIGRTVTSCEPAGGTSGTTDRSVLRL